MVVVAVLVGAQGLGQDIMVALTWMDVGKGFVFGLAVALIAIIADDGAILGLVRCERSEQALGGGRGVTTPVAPVHHLEAGIGDKLVELADGHAVDLHRGLEVVAFCLRQFRRQGEVGEDEHTARLGQAARFAENPRFIDRVEKRLLAPTTSTPRLKC